MVSFNALSPGLGHSRCPVSIWVQPEDCLTGSFPSPVLSGDLRGLLRKGRCDPEPLGAVAIGLHSLWIRRQKRVAR